MIEVIEMQNPVTLKDDDEVVISAKKLKEYRNTCRKEGYNQRIMEEECPNYV